MPATVSCRACASYEAAALDPALQACLEALGGLGSFVDQGDRVFLKPNLLMPAKPEQAVTTHPALVRALIRSVKAAGGVPVVGDNPAATGLRMTAGRAGLRQVAEEEGAELADMAPSMQIRSERAVGGRSFTVSQAVMEADLVINLPKLKTHELCYVTLAQKNLFGLVPGLQKGRWHMTAMAPRHFAGLITDLYAAVIDHPEGPRFLHLLDGVLAMEGNGPGTGGTPRHAGVLLASTDAVALDRVAMLAMGLGADLSPVLQLSVAQGLGVGDLDDIEILGDRPQDLGVEPFKPAKAMKLPEGAMATISNSGFLRNRFLDRPMLVAGRCIACGQCAKVCPAEVITVHKEQERVSFDYGRCIRCFCCAEVCPEAAIERSDTPLAGRLLASGYAPLVMALGLGGGLLGGVGLLVWWLV